MTERALEEALEPALEQQALLLIGDGAPDSFPPSAERYRVPPGALVNMAEGARLVSGGRPVVALGSSDDLCVLGLGSLLHAARRNSDITCIALADDPAEAGEGLAGEYPLESLALAYAAGASFGAAGSLDEQLTDLVRAAVAQPGFAFVQVAAGPREQGEPEGICYIGNQRESFDRLLWNQAPLLSAVWSAEPEVWDRLWWDEEEDDDDEEE